MISKINILAILILLSVLLFGCTTHISQVEKKWGPPAKTEQRKDMTIFYYYFYKGGGVPVITDSILAAAIIQSTSKTGWYVIEITTDKQGKILKKRKYWKQPEIK